MELHYFSAYFEACAALNFIFTGSESFRSGLTQQLMGVLQPVSKSIREWAEGVIEEKLGNTQWAFFPAYAVNAVSNLKKDYLYLKKSKYLRLLETRQHAHFVKNFKSIFLLGGLFSLFALSAEGYDQFCAKDDKLIMPICLSLIAWGVLAVSALILFKSCSNRLKAIKINPFWVGLIFALLTVYAIQFCHQYGFFLEMIGDGEARKIITIPVIAGILPFGLHVLVVVGHKTFYFFRKVNIFLRLLLLAGIAHYFMIFENQQLTTQWFNSRKNELSIQVISEMFVRWLKLRLYKLLFGVHQIIRRLPY